MSSGRGELLCITIGDDGLGMEEEALAHLREELEKRGKDRNWTW